MKAIKIQIKNRWTGDILFEYEAEENTIKKTVEQAVSGGANLSGANLGGADLYGANLSDANLSGAYLYGANLYGANLSGAYLYDAYLYDAYLYDAYLYGANLSGANLGGADLYGANLSGADLSDAYLYGADLYGADLYGADLGVGIKLRADNSIFRVSDIGSRMGTTFAYDTDKGIYVRCGCFFGTLDEFAQAVEKTHGDNKHGKAYKAMIELIKIRFSE